MSKKEKSLLEEACDKKLDEIAEEIAATPAGSEKLKILTDNAEYLKKAKRKDPKGFKNWVSRIEAGDVLKLIFSVGMFVAVLHGEEIGHMLTTRATGFIPWNKTPKL